MSKSSRGRLFGRRSGTVTVIEDRVRRSSARTAKLAFYVTAIMVGLLTATVGSDYTHPILALFCGAFIGIATGAVVWLGVRVWPVLRVLWWWASEIVLAVAGLWAWITLSRHTTLLVRFLILAVVVGIPAGVPYLRRRIAAATWCLICRHRLRVCFAQFIITNRSGSLPFICWARPTGVGERIWVWLRPGLSVLDLEGRLEKLAVACWADTVTVTKTSGANAALIRIDIKRRNALSGTVLSPLLRLITPKNSVSLHQPATIPTALDLPDVAAEQITHPAPAQRDGKDTKNTARPALTPINHTAVAGPGGDDISDFID